MMAPASPDDVRRHLLEGRLAEGQALLVALAADGPYAAEAESLSERVANLDRNVLTGLLDSAAAQSERDAIARTAFSLLDRLEEPSGEVTPESYTSNIGAPRKKAIKKAPPTDTFEQQPSETAPPVPEAWEAVAQTQASIFTDPTPPTEPGNQETLRQQTADTPPVPEVPPVAPTPPRRRPFPTLTKGEAFLLSLITCLFGVALALLGRALPAFLQQGIANRLTIPFQWAWGGLIFLTVLLLLRFYWKSREKTALPAA